ncbi:MAG: hypothetical protein RL338_225 [Chloroflexota bacterium]
MREGRAGDHPAGGGRPLLGGVEAGGTKFVCLVGRGPDAIAASTRIEVADPSATLAAAVAFFADAAERGLAVAALGIGSFGPLQLDPAAPAYGHLKATPKPGWSGAPILAPFADALGVPIGLDTDVDAAALGEGRWGAGRGVRSFVYLTVGTGIGGGAVVDGQVLRGVGHPEMGHIPVPRLAADPFPGACPFHGDCLEGMVSGPALAARFGRRAESLAADERREAVRLVAGYLAAGIATIGYVLAPERVIVGGGVAELPGLVEAVGAAVTERFAGYLVGDAHARPGFVVRPELGAMAGPIGTLVLAEMALSRRPGRGPRIPPADQPSSSVVTP